MSVVDDIFRNVTFGTKPYEDAYNETIERCANLILDKTRAVGCALTMDEATALAKTLQRNDYRKCFVGTLDKNDNHYRFTKKGETRMSEFTCNVKLSPLALKLRHLRLKKNVSVATVAQITKLSEEDIVAFENDKKVPTAEQRKVLLDFLNH